jgi:hypothetical protein
MMVRTVAVMTSTTDSDIITTVHCLFIHGAWPQRRVDPTPHHIPQSVTPYACVSLSHGAVLSANAISTHRSGSVSAQDSLRLRTP